jgi:hypothetical protein
VKLLVAFSLLAGVALGQSPGKVITFNQSDAEHCKIVVAHGKPLLRSTYEGTTVAIGMPLNRSNGDFSIFISVSRSGDGAIEVNPKDFYGVFSDKDQTRFRFFDTAAALEMAHPADAGVPFSSANVRIEAPPTKPVPVGGKGSLGDGDVGNAPPSSLAGTNSPDLYFRKGKVKPGSAITGWVTLRQPSAAKLEVHPTDMLGEVDIPVNGVLFRF